MRTKRHVRRDKLDNWLCSYTIITFSLAGYVSLLWKIDLSSLAGHKVQQITSEKVF